jgi:hypothetical protein
MSCCICQLSIHENTKQLFMQVHSCKESLMCFGCLVAERQSVPEAETHKTPAENWWECSVPLRCPICRTPIDFSPPEILLEYIGNLLKEHDIDKYERLLGKLAVAESRVQVMESQRLQDQLAYRKLDDKYEKTLIKLCTLEDDLRHAHKEIIQEQRKNSDLTTRIMNTSKRLREVIDEDDDEFITMLTPCKKRKDDSYTFVNPDIHKSYPLSDLFAENSQSQ